MKIIFNENQRCIEVQLSSSECMDSHVKDLLATLQKRVTDDERDYELQKITEENKTLNKLNVKHLIEIQQLKLRLTQLEENR